MLSKYTKNNSWFSIGDIGAAPIIIFDNLSILLFVSSILQFGFKFPAQIIYYDIVPGTVMGVICGNILCLWLRTRLVKEYGASVMAMPHGLDAPSALGVASCILGPAFLVLKSQGLDANTAAIQAWHIGACCLLMTGVIKLCASSFVNLIHKYLPAPALFGAIGGLAIAIIGLFPLLSLFKVSIVGFPVLAILLICMYAKIRLPYNIPAIPVAIISGTILYYLFVPLGLTAKINLDHTSLALSIPHLNLNAFHSFSMAFNYLPVVIPFSLLVICGTISVVEGANSIGQEQYKTKQLMILDSIATIISAMFGGVSQTTPYAGFIAYKKMEARAGFMVLNILFVGFGAFFGVFAILVNLVPEAAISPILLFVAFEITMQGFHRSDFKYTVAILFSFFPSIARLLIIKIPDGALVSQNQLQTFILGHLNPQITDQFVIALLGNGFFISAALWASWLCYAIDHKRRESFICAVLLSVFSLFGVVHSVYLDGHLYLPTYLPIALQKIVAGISAGYLITGIITWILLSPRFRERRAIKPEH